MTARIEDVLITGELAGRPIRAPDYQAETMAMAKLARTIATSPGQALLCLADVMVELCLAESAGISIREEVDGQASFRWHAISGLWAGYVGGTIPFDASPCGVVIARDEALLFTHPEQVFPAAAIEPLVEEVLLIPFHVEDVPVGTLWAVAHTADRKFDAEDARLLGRLAQFASAAWQLTEAIERSGRDRRSLEERVEEQARTQQTLGETEEIFRLAIEAAMMFAFDIDVETMAVTHSANTAAVLGFPVPDDLRLATDLVHPDDRAGNVARMKEVIRDGRPFSHEYRFVDPGSGAIVWVRTSGRVTRDSRDGRPRLVGVVRNITPRKRMEEALRESEDHYRTAVELNPQLSWTATPDGKVDLMSPKWEEWTGTDGLGENWTIANHPDDLPEMKRKWAHSIRTGDPLDSEQRIRMRDGSYRWTRTRAYPRRDQSGRILKWYGVTEDIHEQRSAQEHQRTLLAELQHRVRNTLAVIRSIARRTAENSDSVEEMAAHLDGRLAAFSRVQGVVTRDPEAGIDLTALIEDSLLAHAAREGEHVTIAGPDLFLKPRAAESLSLAIHELASNAVKYGALGDDRGRIAIDWRCDDAEGTLRLVWEENGLAGITVPERSGFGMELLLRSLPYDLRAETDVEFRPEGLRFTLVMPLVDRQRGE